MAMSNNLVGAINFLAILLSIPIISTGVWLSTETDNACVNLVQWPTIGLGVATLVVATAGFVGAFWRVPWLLFFYMVTMLVLILLLLCLVSFVYIVTVRGSGHLPPGRLYLEYELEDYPGWIKEKVTASSHKWNEIKSCLRSSSVCSHLNHTYSSAQDFFVAPLTPIQSGCCKPLTRCGFTFINPTVWINPINPTADLDCLLWSNDQTQLCYSCSSCKAGLLADLKREWRKADLILLVTLVLLVSVYVMGCFAFRNAKTEELFRKYRQGYYT